MCMGPPSLRQSARADPATATGTVYFRGFSLKTMEKHPPKGTLQAEGQVWRQLMAFHLRELQKHYRQNTGSAAKLLQANQLKHHSLEDGSEQSSTVWIFFMKRALEQIPFSPTKTEPAPAEKMSPRAPGSTHGWAGRGPLPPWQGTATRCRFMPLSCSLCHLVHRCWLPG